MPWSIPAAYFFQFGTITNYDSVTSTNDLPPGTNFVTGSNLSGFEVLDTDATAPTSIQYFAFGNNNGARYTGPGNINPVENAPFFIGDAVVTIPEPGSISLLAVAGMLGHWANWRRNGCGSGRRCR